MSIFVDELISTPKFITFPPVPSLGWEKNPCQSNPISYPEYLYLSISAFLDKLTAPNKYFSGAWITANIMIFTYLINIINVYYFSVSICNFILLHNISTKF